METYENPYQPRDILQDDDEFRELMNLARVERVRSYLEIGAKWGGSVWRMSYALPGKSRIAIVDLPKPDTETHLKECAAQLENRSFEVHLILGDSIAPKTIEAVRALAPFDLCFIDGDHTEPYVRGDWENYGSLARIVAFHDVTFDGPTPGKRPVDCRNVWNDVKRNYRHREIKHHPTHFGIGVLWR